VSCNPSTSIHGRGTGSNPANRFVRLEVLPDLEIVDVGVGPQTQFFADSSRQVIARNDSPDVGFEFSINPYRGCEHGCIYCYARPTHEYLGFSVGLDFETRIMVKRDAPAILRRELSSPKYQPAALAFSGVTDCYQPIERKLRITRGCLEVLHEFRNPVSIITKNHLVTRDIDLLKDLATYQAATVVISITTLDAALAGKMEPRASSPRRRLQAIAELSAAGIPVGVMVAPVVPGLTEHEMPAILKEAAKSGAFAAGFEVLRLPYAVKDLFAGWLEAHYPDRKDKVLNRIRELRGGKLNDPHFTTRMTGQGIWAEQFRSMFNLAKKTAEITKKYPQLSTQAFRVPGQAKQMTLW